jgi:hypothetical protein
VVAPSNARQLNITAVGDLAHCPAIDVFANRLRDTLRSLGAAVDPGPG